MQPVQTFVEPPAPFVPPPGETGIATACCWIATASGDRILATLNRPAFPVRGTVVILPPFGTGIYDLFMPAFYLASAGFRVIRFAGRQNVGQSSGQITQYRLSTSFDDAALVAGGLCGDCGGRFQVVGMSMAAPAALNLLRDYRHAGAVLIVPAVDVCETIELAAKEPGGMMPYRVRAPDAPPTRTIFGFEVDAQPFHDDLAERGLDTIDGALALGREARGRVDLILAERDEYLSPVAAHRLIEALDAGERCLSLPRVSHEFGRSLFAAKAGFAELVRCCEEYFGVEAKARLMALPSVARLVAAANDDQAAIEAFLAGQQEG